MSNSQWHDDQALAPTVFKVFQVLFVLIALNAFIWLWVMTLMAIFEALNQGHPL